MKKNIGKINIVLASDNNYIQHLGVTLISILENSKKTTKIAFYILEDGINDENKKKLKSISEKYGANIIFCYINKSLTINFPEMGHLSRATYFRLFIPWIIPQEIQKIIYLDCDLIVLKDISSLYKINLQGKSMAAVEDVKSQEIIRIYFYPNLKKYFNAGVLLINLDSWRKKNITQKAIGFINQHHHNLTTADQDVLNCLLNNDWLEIPRIYNLDPKHSTINSLPTKNTVILHYSDTIKPWSYLYVGKNKKYYFQYLALSPWKNFKYKDKNIKNLFKKYHLVGRKIIANNFRTIVPPFLIDWNKKRFNNKIKNKNHKY